MDDISTVDGFVEITECVAEMLKYLANEPSVGLFYVQQHTQNSVPNLVSLRNSVEDKSREMTLHTEDSGESMIMLSSMKECGSPIVDEMIRDIKNSLTIMSTKQPKRGLINNPRSLFQIGRTSSWGPAAWGRNEVPLEQEAESSSSSYFSTVFKSAKERAASLKWVQSDSEGSVNGKGENLLPAHDTTLQYAVPSTASAMLEEPMLSSKISSGSQEMSETGDGLSTNLLSLSKSFDEFKAEREAKLEQWLQQTSDQDDQLGETNAEKL
ncbi:hypothetical protein DCAR_0521843 [Daucus carota subsp. sativus]|uniref:Uncharacterized protein n=2 Tax=Daucus carota subsp. sativus TaxID=79200 RepID=A0A162A3Y1_DAUCS|nr:PREDICTED: uncharacterized protein LOC108220222 isoform X2 [Daucus carota subsp. sativus]WOH02454.1 hypothetical protein DCAR_0521843 [Daucus carota subsp. sativus]